MAKGFVRNLEELTAQNSNFRKVIYTAKHSQLVLMCLKPSEEIGMETHPDNDQFLRIESGEGKAIIDGNEQVFSSGFCVVVPAGSRHNIINTSANVELKLYTVYSPPHHKDATIHETKEIAMSSEEDFDGVTSE
ncbi:MAG: cupin domain-containing protein [Candidatus Woesebacteria bacterium]|nr:MAG: cupin domain-containing protein [Candidatus Woesebacteria bacterium]